MRRNLVCGLVGSGVLALADEGEPNFVVTAEGSVVHSKSGEPVRAGDLVQGCAYFIDLGPLFKEPKP